MIDDPWPDLFIKMLLSDDQSLIVPPAVTSLVIEAPIVDSH